MVPELISTGLAVTALLLSATLAQTQTPAAGVQTPAAVAEAVAQGTADAQEEGKPGIAGGHSQAAFIAAYDTDGDGRVGLGELITARTSRLAGADKDGDGAYNEAEYIAEYEARLRKQYADQGKEPGGEKFAEGLKQAGVRFALLDRDRDGRLTLEEDLRSARKTFARNDTDGDGFVTAGDPRPPREDEDDADAAAPAAN